MRKLSLLFSIVLLCLPVYAQSWSGILNPTRAANWQRSSVGVPGGIPTTYTQCGATIAAYTGDASTINNAIAACGANTYLLLGVGTFNLSTGINIQGKSKFVLRGSGPNSTTLAFTNGINCLSGAENICIQNSNGLYGGSNNTLPPCISKTACADWTAGFAQGATSITVANVGSLGILNGDMIAVDRQNDTTDNGGFMVCDSTPSSGTNQFGNTVTAPGGAIVGPYACHQIPETSSGNGRIIGGWDYSQEQWVRVTAGCVSACVGAGPFTLTISPGLYGNNYAGSNKGVFFTKPVSYVGLENMTLDNTNSSARSNVGMNNADSWWMKNVRSIRGVRNHMYLNDSTHGEIRDSYFFGTANASNQSYGIEIYGSDNLVENNIFQQVASPLVGPGGDSGNVYAYNFSIDNVFNPPAWQQVTYNSHDAGNSFNLYEGNQMAGIGADDVHGTSGLDTLFRNRLIGQDYNTASGCTPPCLATNGTVAAEFLQYNRGLNLIGNIIGKPGFHTAANGGVYEYYAGGSAVSTANCNFSIFSLGAGAICNNLSNGGAPNDPLVRSTMMRWGNYDTVSAAVRWDNIESSPGAVTYIAAQSTPASHSLPASFYLSGKPNWWGAMPFPAIGPDVTGGTGPGGYSYNIPAANCYYNIMSGPVDGSGSALPFDANVCYLRSGSAPAAPTSISAIAH
jgi:hypothetical protein